MFWSKNKSLVHLFVFFQKNLKFKKVSDCHLLAVILNQYRKNHRTKMSDDVRLSDEIFVNLKKLKNYAI